MAEIEMKKFEEIKKIVKEAREEKDVCEKTNHGRINFQDFEVCDFCRRRPYITLAKIEKVLDEV